MQYLIKPFLPDPPDMTLKCLRMKYATSKTISTQRIRGIMDFGNFREMSVKIGNYKKKLRKPSGKRRVHSVSGRRADGKHPTFSGRHPKLFIISDLYGIVTEICRSTCRHRTKFFEVHYTPFTLKDIGLNETPPYKVCLGNLYRESVYMMMTLLIHIYIINMYLHYESRHLIYK